MSALTPVTVPHGLAALSAEVPAMPAQGTLVFLCRPFRAVAPNRGLA